MKKRALFSVIVLGLIVGGCKSTTGPGAGGGGGENGGEEGKPVLTVVRNGEGLVVSDPEGISCGIDCSEAYDTGTVVTLTASASYGYVFDGWGGACFGSSSTCTVTMDGNKTVIANFSEAPPLFFDHFNTPPLSNGWSYGPSNAPGAVVTASGSFAYASAYGSGSSWFGGEIMIPLDSAIDISTRNFELAMYVNLSCSDDYYDDGLIEMALVDDYNERLIAVFAGDSDGGPDYGTVRSWMVFHAGGIVGILPDGDYIYYNGLGAITGVVKLRKEGGVVSIWLDNTELTNTAFSSSSRVATKLRLRFFRANDSPCPTIKTDWVRVKFLP